MRNFSYYFKIMFAILLLGAVGSAVTAATAGTADSRQQTENNMPIIGVFAQPSSSSNEACGGDCQYIAGSYVKYLESAGARVVPIDFHSSDETIDHLFDNLNGFFFPGGGAVFPAAAQYVFDKTVAANTAGDFMPLWGTCMGFQWLLISASGDQDVLDPNDGTQMDSYNYSIPVCLVVYYIDDYMSYYVILYCMLYCIL